jgi:Arc/MetJ-type ribon-helix-helix transcriptional regulator
MKRITISLPDGLADRIASEAELRHVSLSELVREAIMAMVEGREDEPDEVPFLGMFDSDRLTHGRDVKQLLAREWPDAIRGR